MEILCILEMHGIGNGFQTTEFYGNSRYADYDVSVLANRFKVSQLNYDGFEHRRPTFSYSTCLNSF